MAWCSSRPCSITREATPSRWPMYGRSLPLRVWWAWRRAAYPRARMKRPVSWGPPADDCDADLRLGMALFSHLPFADAMRLARRARGGDTEPAHGFLQAFA